MRKFLNDDESRYVYGFIKQFRGVFRVKMNTVLVEGGGLARVFIVERKEDLLSISIEKVGL